MGKNGLPAIADATVADFDRVSFDFVTVAPESSQTSTPKKLIRVTADGYCEPAIDSGPQESEAAHQGNSSSFFQPSSSETMCKNIILGRGCAAIVYKGSYNDGTYAIKCFLPTELGQAQFENELRFLQVLPRHDSVLLARYFVHNEKNNLLLLTYMPLGDLSNYLEQLKRKNQRLKWRAHAFGWCYDVASGLAFLHNRGVIHFDVQTKNILIGERGAKLTDLGIARFEGETFEDSRRDYFTYFWYRAPEVTLNKKAITASDIYGFAIVLYEMVTLEKIFGHSDPKHLQLSIDKGITPKLPKGKGPKIIRGLYRRCSLFDPSKRPKATELVRKLKSRSINRQSPIVEDVDDMCRGEDSNFHRVTPTST